MLINIVAGLITAALLAAAAWSCATARTSDCCDHSDVRGGLRVSVAALLRIKDDDGYRT